MTKSHNLWDGPRVGDHVLRCFFCGRRPLPFGGSHLRLPSGPAGIRTTTGSLSALARPTPHQLSHQVALLAWFLHIDRDLSQGPWVGSVDKQCSNSEVSSGDITGRASLVADSLPLALLRPCSFVYGCPLKCHICQKSCFALQRFRPLEITATLTLISTFPSLQHPSRSGLKATTLFLSGCAVQLHPHVASPTTSRL